MSRLRELRLHGFKTFADPTRFVFEPGVNAVIGPNGSGKSNMADAVRWVLGEQSNRSLRTRRADDVIFAGSQQRRPQGMAEAILTLDNADGWLPIEFGEVTIGRRSYRSGESEYLINGARARLRDVVELLGSGRLGANELVVVGQGTVDAALSLRPEERRQLFEEAAGVKNLQVRKNEALSRLARARDNLTRVTDLIAGIRPQVRRLELQARHQQEHDSLGRRAHALVAESHRRRESESRSALGMARRRAAAAEAALEERRSAQADAHRLTGAAEERYWQAETAARAAADKREAAREALIRAESRLENLAARIGELGAGVVTARNELAELEAPGRTAGTDADTDLGPTLAAAGAAQERWRVATAALAEADATTLAAEEALAAARAAQAERVVRRAQLAEQTAGARARREQLGGELEARRRELAASAGQLGPARESARVAGEALDRARHAHRQALDELGAAQPRADEARRRATELAERVGGMRGELDALRERLERGGRLGSLLSAAGWPALLDELSPPAEAWAAIEAVVGGELEQALVWREGELGRRLAGVGGSARLLAAVDGVVDPAERAAALAAVGANRTLAEWVGDESGLRLFARAAVAPSLEALLGGWHALPAGWVAVSPHGDLADERGLLAVRGRAETASGEAARRHARRRDLAARLEAVEREQEESAAAAARAHAAVGEAQRRLEASQAKLSAAEATARQASAAAEAAELEQQHLAAEVDDLSAARAELAAAPLTVEGASPTSDETEITELRRRADAAHGARDVAARERDAAREAWQGLRAVAAEAEARLTDSQRSRTLTEARVAQLRAQLPQQEIDLAALETDRATAEAIVADTRRVDDEASQERREAEAARETARTELLELERSATGSAARLTTLEHEVQVAMVEVSRREEALAALARERALAIESLPEVPDDAGAAPAEAEPAALADDDLDTELRNVRRTLAKIGSVNPFAVEEHQELSGQLDELAGQEADLSSAITATEQLIARLDGEIGSQFQAAFVAIGERFDEFCRLLFAGGSAKLQFGEETDGDGDATAAGIEIVVRPPGKRLQRLAMLSGGERALTGVALLFAMLSVNPVPFCILDEVDAALDEANIGRFAEALRRLAERIDFVVITHNRATIEVADTIYGVTLSDAAVSHVVSLRLTDLPAEATAEMPA